MNGSLYDAYGVLDVIYQMDSRVRDLPFLLQYCASLMVTDRDDEAAEAYQLILVIIRDVIRSSFEEVLAVAEKFNEKSKNLQAAILALVARDMSDKNVFTPHNAQKQVNCLSELRDAARLMTDKNSRTRPFVKKKIVPAMLQIKDDILQTEDNLEFKEKLIKLKIAMLHGVETTQLHAHDIDGRIETLRLALLFMEQMYENQVRKKHFYGVFLHNLGATFIDLFRIDEAITHLREALQVLMDADDFEESNESKEKHVQSTTRVLRLAELAFM